METGRKHKRYHDTKQANTHTQVASRMHVIVCIMHAAYARRCCGTVHAIHKQHSHMTCITTCLDVCLLVCCVVAVVSTSQ